MVAPLQQYKSFFRVVMERQAQPRQTNIGGHLLEINVMRLKLREEVIIVNTILAMLDLFKLLLVQTIILVFVLILNFQQAPYNVEVLQLLLWESDKLS